MVNKYLTLQRREIVCYNHFERFFFLMGVWRVMFPDDTASKINKVILYK